jgi:pyranose oxidase
VQSAETVALDTGRTTSVSADVVLVALGGIRTPALLWASGIGRDSALGRYLCDHPLAYAQILLDTELLEADGPDPDPFVIVPIGEDRQFHSLLLCDGYDAALFEGRVDERLILSLYWYTMSEPRQDNRLRFGEHAMDAMGLPQPTFEYSLDDQDRDRQEAALADLRATAGLLGRQLPNRPPHTLSPGSSMHVMGTTRMGEADDGDSVVDTFGRVWGMENLYLGGTGLIPCATATNPTLAACAIAVRTAERITKR